MEFRIEKDTMGDVQVPAENTGVRKQSVPEIILRLVQPQACL